MKLIGSVSRVLAMVHRQVKSDELSKYRQFLWTISDVNGVNPILIFDVRQKIRGR